MLKTVEGVYRDGKIELKESMAGVHDEIPVLVTFLEPDDIDLQGWGMGDPQAADLRARLATFAGDWESSEMRIYDRYHAAKANL
jgi:hypothetical protein